MELKPRKIIAFDSCLDCPRIEKCKEWQSLSKKNRFALTLGVGINIGILKNCTLEEHITICAECERVGVSCTCG